MKRMGNKNKGKMAVMASWMLASCLALSAHAQTKEECLQTLKLPMDDLSTVKPEEKCQANKDMLIDGGRCVQSWTKLKKIYVACTVAMQQRCEVAEQISAKRSQCKGETGQSACMQAIEELDAEATRLSENYRENISSLRAQLKEASKAGIEGAEGYAKSIEKMGTENAGIEPLRNNARDVPGALAKHNGQNPVMAVIAADQVRRAIAKDSDVSRSEVLKGIPSPIIKEQLNSSLVMATQNKKLKEYEDELAAKELQLKEQSVQLKKKNTELGSINSENKDGKDSKSGFSLGNMGSTLGLAASGMGLAAAAANLSKASGGGTSDTSLLSSAPAAPSAIAPTSLRSNSGKSDTGAVIPLAGHGGTGNTENVYENHSGTNGGSVTGGSGSSRSSISSAALKENLKNRLAQNDEGSPSGELSSNAGGAKAPEEKKVGFSPQSGEMGVLGNLAGGPVEPKFIMQNSDTDEKVKDLLKNFDGVSAAEPELASARSPASFSPEEIRAQEAAIAPENSPSLFKRNHSVFERCLKRGCVTSAGMGKRKI